MKETWKQTLTSKPQKTYPKGGDNYMTEPGQGEMPPKSPEGKGPNDQGRQKSEPISDEMLFAKEIADLTKEYPHMKWDDWGVGLKRAMTDHWRSKRASAAGGNQDQKKGTGPQTATGGAGGGDKPPEKPPENPRASVGDDPNEGESGESREEGAGPFSINTEGFGITNESLLNFIKVAEEGVKYAGSDEERYSALLESLKAVQTLPSKDDPLGQKPLAAEAIRERLDKIFQKRARNAERALSLDERERMRGTIQELRGTILDKKMSDGEKMDIIESLIDSMDLNDRAYPHVVTEAIKGVEDKGVDHLIEDVLEYSLERFLNRADASPDQDYPQFTFTESENISVIINTARIFDEKRRARGDGVRLGTEPGRREMFQYLTTLNNRRRVMHELFKSMNDLESFTGLITKALRKSGMIFVEKQLPGVSDVQVIYDQALLFLKSVKPSEKGWLSEDDFEIGDRMVKKQLEESMRDHPDIFFKTFIKNDGKPDGIREARALRQWEIDRAFHMGRDLSGAAQRRVVYGILGDVPENVDEFLKSVVHEPLARRLAPLKLIPDRFFSHGLAKRFLSIFKQEQKRDLNTGIISDTKYGYVTKDKDGKEVKRGLFGSSQDDFAILDLGIVDPKSNSWRSRLLYLKNSNFKTEKIDGNSVTIGDYLDTTKKAQLAGKRPSEKKAAIEEWNREIAETISSQRLFLGTLMRYPDLSPENKTAIWKNVAEYMPSRIGSLLPNEAIDLIGRRFGLEGNRNDSIEKWKGIAEKLWIAERMRLSNDARVLSGRGGDFHDSPNGDHIGHYLEKVGLKDEEKLLVGEIISLGEKFAPDLSKIKFPFTAFLDDAPETNWEGLSDFDFTRILVSDQNAFQEGYGHLTGLFENPAKKPEDAAKILIEAFEKIKGPPGVIDAQKIFEPIVKATAKMRQMNSRAKWMGATFARMLRIPTSPVEEYNLQAHIADDENDGAGLLHALAQQQVVNDDPHELDEKGRTQYQRSREDLDVDKKAVLMAYIRLIIQLFGPAFGLEFAKALGIKMPQ